MKKILLSIFASSLLFANEIVDELEQIKLENKILHERINKLEKKIYHNDDIFSHFDNLFQEQERYFRNFKAKMNLANNFENLNNYEIFSTSFSNGRIFSSISKKAENVKFQNIDIKTQKAISLKQMLKNEKEFKEFLQKINPKLNPNNLFIDKFGFHFFSDDLKITKNISLNEMKGFLAEDFLQQLD